MRYCIDANFFIHLWRSYLSPEISSSFWDWLDELFGKGIIFVPEEVFEEIAVGNDALYAWLNKNKAKVFCDLNEAVQTALLDIVHLPNAIELIDSNKRRHSADVFLVAYAKAYNLTVVSDDTGVGRLCKSCGVRNIKSFEFLKEQKLKLEIPK